MKHNNQHLEIMILSFLMLLFAILRNYISATYRPIVIWLIAILILFFSFKFLCRSALNKEVKLEKHIILITLGIPFYKIVYLYSKNINEVPFISFLIVLAMYIGLLSMLYLPLYISTFVKKIKKPLIKNELAFHYFIFILLIALFNIKNNVLEEFFLILACLFTFITLSIAYVDKQFFILCRNIAIILYCFSSFTVISIITENKIIQNKVAKEEEIIKAKTKTSKNIYIIVLDMYAGSKTLKSFNFDNSNFYNELKNRDFLVKKDIYSNYNKTSASIASFLNLNYLENLNFKTANQAIDESILFDVLKKSNYKIWYLNAYPEMINVDMMSHLDYSSNGTDKQRMNSIYFLLSNTIFNEYIFINNEKKEENIANFIDNAINCDLRKIVFLHFLMPHWPYVYNENGERLNLTQDLYVNGAYLINHENYIKYLKYTNKMTLSLIDKIMQSQEDKPIIVLLGDHGIRKKYYISNEKNYYNELIKDPTHLEMHFNSFLAYYNPDDKNDYTNTKTIINFFRKSANEILKTNLKPLEDRFFYIYYDKDPGRNLQNIIGKYVKL